MPEPSFANKQLPLLSSPVTPPPAVYLWDELPEIQDGAARGALVGIPLENLKSTYRARLDRTIEEIEKRSSLYNAAINSGVERLTRELGEYEASRKSLEAASESKREALPDLRKTESEQDAEVRGILLTMLGEREDFQAQHESELRATYHQQQLEGLDHQQKITSSRANVARQDLEANPEWAKRVESDLHAEIESAVEAVREARGACRRLQEKGLTRAVARFLTWAPLISFAGAGLLLGGLFSSGGGSSAYFRFLQLLGAATHMSVLSLFGKYALLLAAILLLMNLSVLGAFLLLGKLDPTREKRSRQRGTRNLASPAEVGKPISSRQLDLNVLARRFQVKGRLALLRSLPFIPFALALAVALFFRVATATPETGVSQPGSPSLQEILLGALFVMSSAGSGLPFWLFVLRPSLDREPVGGGVKTFYSLLVALPLAVLISAEAFPSLAGSLAIALAGITAIVASIAVGHGIYLRGIFERADVAVTEHGHLQEAFALVTRKPVAGDYIEEDAPSPIRPPLEHTRGSARWCFWRRGRRSAAPLSIDEEIRALIKDAHVPPDLVDRVSAACKELAIARCNRSSVEEDHARLDQELSRVRTSIAENLEELGRMLRFQVDVLDAHGFLILRLRTEHERIVQALEDAYKLAHASRAGGQEQQFATVNP